MTRSTNLMLSGAAVCFAATDSKTAVAAKTPAPKTVLEDMDSRRIFTTTADAAAYLTKCATEISDFGTTPAALVGIVPNEAGDGVDFDPAVYTESMNVMVAVLRNQKVAGKVKAIVVAPVPTIDSVLADPSAKAWLEKIMQKELNHVAVRPLREAEDITTVSDQIPKTLGAYTSGSREQTGIVETFNELYKQLNDTMSANIAVWKKARLVKSDLKRAFESKGFAEEYYPSIENRGEGKDSLFVTALQIGINAAKRKGMDPTIFERWLSGRDAAKFDAANVEEDDDFDVDSLTSSLMDEPAAAAAPAADEAKTDEPAAAETAAAE